MSNIHYRYQTRNQTRFSDSLRCVAATSSLLLMQDDEPLIPVPPGAQRKQLNPNQQRARLLIPMIAIFSANNN